MNLSTEKKIMILENRIVVAWGMGKEWKGLGAWDQRMVTIAHGMDLQ